MNDYFDWGNSYSPQPSQGFMSQPQDNPWFDFGNSYQPQRQEPVLRGRQPSDDPYSELRGPVNQQTGVFQGGHDFSWGKAGDLAGQPFKPQLAPDMSTEEMLNMYDPGRWFRGWCCRRYG